MPYSLPVTCLTLSGIAGSDCIGDTRSIINDNTYALGTTLCNLSSNTITLSTTSTVQHTFVNSTRLLASDVRNNSIDTRHLIDNSVITAKLSAEAVTTDKIALSAITNDKIALSAVTADKINLVTSLSSNGYQIMPGGLIMQWGNIGPFTTQVSPSATFPISFPTNCINAQVTARIRTAGGLGPQGTFGQIVRFDSNRIQVQVQNAEIDPFDPTDIFWLAIGY